MQILEQLGSGEGLPTEAIRAATADRTIVAPQLVEAIESCKSPNENEEQGLFFAFHLLGQWREQSAYRTLARFLRRPDAESILGDATTATCHRVIASVFDGDPRPIFDIIRDSEADEFIRGQMFDALVILVFQGQLERTAVAVFLRAAFEDLQSGEQPAVWDGWERAVALLALTELEPLVREAFRRGFIDGLSVSLKDFEEDLRRACAGLPLQPWQQKEYEPFGDVIEELSSWVAFKPKQSRNKLASGWRPDHWPGMPVHNPLRNVGRNDPCPCGSGKKFKKCCLGKEELPEFVAPGDPFDVDEGGELDDIDEFDDIDGPVQEYDALVGPGPEDWLATGEQQRIDLVERYHYDEGIEVERPTLHATMHVIVENQIAEGDKLPVGGVLRRLMAEGLDRHDAVHAIGAVLAGHIHHLMQESSSQKPESGQQASSDVNAAYFSELEALTAESWLRSG